MADTRQPCSCGVNCEGFIRFGQRCQELPAQWSVPLAPEDAEVERTWKRKPESFRGRSVIGIAFDAILIVTIIALLGYALITGATHGR